MGGGQPPPRSAAAARPPAPRDRPCGGHPRSHPCCPPATPPALLRRYTALLYRPTNLANPIFSLALTASGITDNGITSFTEDVALPAGPYRLEVATENVHGQGGKSVTTAEFTVGEAPTHAGAAGRGLTARQPNSASGQAMHGTGGIATTVGSLGVQLQQSTSPLPPPPPSPPSARTHSPTPTPALPVCRHLHQSRHQQRHRRHQRCAAAGDAPRHHGRRRGGHLPHPGVQQRGGNHQGGAHLHCAADAHGGRWPLLLLRLLPRGCRVADERHAPELLRLSPCTAYHVCHRPHLCLHPAVWGGGARQQHGQWGRRQGPGHGLCLCLPLPRPRQAVVQGHCGVRWHTQRRL